MSSPITRQIPSAPVHPPQHNGRSLQALALCASVCLSITTGASAQVPCELTRVSVGVSEGNENSLVPSVSADGRFVTFSSRSFTLVAGDNNNQWDVFRVDRATGEILLVSRSSNGVLGNRLSRWSSTTADGRYVVFESLATNLVPGDTNNAADIFVHDAELGRTGRVTINASGVQANQTSSLPRISADGAVIVFSSIANNLVGGDTNAHQDVFVKDRTTGLMTRVSISSSGVQGNSESGGDHSQPGCSVSDDGRYVAFESRSSNLVTPDANASSDIFLRDRQNSTTVRLSSDAFGAVGNGDSIGPVLSGDGKWVVFSSSASNLVSDDTNGVSDVFLVELQTGLITCVSRSVLGVEGNLESTQATISRDGRFVGFISQAANLLAGDTNGEPDAFVLDRQNAQLRRVSLTASGGQAAGWSSNLMLSADGFSAVFASAAPNLVPGDNNSRVDIFAGAPGVGSTPGPYCVSSPNTLGCLPQMGFTGCPSASIGSGFVLSCTDVRNAQQGWIVYSMSGAASLPFQSGTLCVQPPFQSTVMVPSGGHPPPWNLCDGVMSLDFNAFAVGALGGTPDPALTFPGTQVFAQWMGSDPVPGSPNNVMLSNAVSFQLAP